MHIPIFHLPPFEGMKKRLATRLGWAFWPGETFVWRREKTSVSDFMWCLRQIHNGKITNSVAFFTYSYNPAQALFRILELHK